MTEQLSSRRWKLDLQTVGWLQTAQDVEEIAALALEKNVDIIPLSRYCKRKQVAPGFQIGFAGVDGRSIARGVQLLGANHFMIRHGSPRSAQALGRNTVSAKGELSTRQ